jgi:hypothetical protein
MPSLKASMRNALDSAHNREAFLGDGRAGLDHPVPSVAGAFQDLRVMALQIEIADD